MPGEKRLPNPPIVDANVLLRYLLDDHPELSSQAKSILDSGSQFFLPNEVICEVVYVLAKVYGVGRVEIAASLGGLALRPQFVFCQREVVRLALETYGQRSIDIVDALLFATNRLLGTEVITFDRLLAIGGPP